MEKWKVSEVDLIMYCIENEIPNKKKAEKRFKTFQTKGKLDGNSIKSFMEDILTSYTSIEIAYNEEGKLTTGRGRQYLVGKLREERINRKTNNNGLVVAKDQDAILKEYVFNRLIDSKLHSNIYPIAIWSDIIEVFNINHLDRQDIRELYEEYYYKNE